MESGPGSATVTIRCIMISMDILCISIEACGMISWYYDITGIAHWQLELEWSYQSTYLTKLSFVIFEKSTWSMTWISYMPVMTRNLYPQPKTRCIFGCRSRALQVQVQDDQTWNPSRRRWFSALLRLDHKALLVLGVRHIQTGYVLHLEGCCVLVMTYTTLNTQPARIYKWFKLIGLSYWI